MKTDIFIHPSADVSSEAIIGNGTKIWHHCQVREKVNIGNNCILSKGVYIDTAVEIGDNVKIQNGVSVYQGVKLEDGVFCGPHCVFTNDKTPRSINLNGSQKDGEDWEISKTLVKKGASIGANATIICGIIIGEWAMVGAGAIVTKDIPDYGLMVGNPAKLIGFVCPCGERLSVTEEQLISPNQSPQKTEVKMKCKRCASEIFVSQFDLYQSHH